MAIQNDFTIYPESKVIRHTSGTTVYSAVAFYSWLMDTFDEPGYLTYEVPIRFNTPTSFTMINSWYLDNGDGSNILQYLSSGGIDTTGYSTASDPIYMLDMDGTTDFVSSDKDNVITDDASDVGPLLAYINDYPTAGSARIWVRDTNSNGTIADSSVIATTSGTGAGTANGASVSGDEVYHNLFTIASFPGSPDPQVYVYQQHPADSTQRVRIAEWSAFTNWDRGSIDVLFPVRLGGSLVDSGNIKTFVRQTGDTFTFVESTLNTSGRTPIATETSADEVNITEGEHYLLYSGSNTGSFSDGDVITDVQLSSGTPPTWYAEVVSVTEFTDTTTGLLELRGLRGTIGTGETIYVDDVSEGTTNGSPGDTKIEWSSGTDPTTLGQVMTGGTSGAKRLLRGVDAAENVAVLQDDPTGVTGTSRDAYYLDFSNGETVTGASDGSVTLESASNTLISGFNDVTVAHVNGTVPTGSFTGTFTRGERVTWNTGSSSAILVDYVTDTSVTLANVDSTDEPVSTDVFVGDLSGAQATASAGLTDANTEDYNFSLQSAFNYSVFVEGGSIYNTGRSLTDIYAYLQYYVRDGQSISDRIIYTSDGSSITEVAAEEYIKADSTYSSTKQAPFGTLAGGVFFGAQGVWIEGMRSADENNIKLTDATGTLREPFTSVTVSVTNTRADDRIAIYPEAGSTTLPDKDQYTSHATLNTQGRSLFDQDAASSLPGLPNDTPQSGTFIVVDSSADEEHRYRYDSYVNTGGDGDDGQFTLPTALTGTSDGTTSGQTLEDASENWSSSVFVGDIVRNTTTDQWGYVTNVDNAASGIVTTTLLNDGSGWTAGDAYNFHSLVVAYDGTDTFFVPYIDTIEDTGTDGTPGSISVTLTYVQDREVVIEARNVEASTQIVPFKTTGQITSSGLTQSVIRTEDTVYT